MGSSEAVGSILERGRRRWYPLRPHAIQDQLRSEGVRFKVVAAGRRSGKTELAKRHIVRQAFGATHGRPYFVAAPTRDQVKKIYWEDLKLLSFAQRGWISESELSIRLPGASIWAIGLDEPARIEGPPWAGGVIDEIASIKPSAWERNIKPALDTSDGRDPSYRAWAWLIGVPEGLNHFFELAEYARTSGDPQWKFYTWHSSDILPLDVIEEARRALPIKVFKQEYEASFETASSRIYEEFGADNVTSEILLPHEQIWWCHDFNYSPLSSAVAVKRENGLWVLGEIVLTSAIARQAALEFVERYKDHSNKSVVVYGDPSGRAGEKHGHQSDYTELEGVLRGSGWTVSRKVKSKAPAIRDRQNAVRAKIRNANGDISLWVNPALAPTAHRGLSTVSLKPGSTFLEEESESQHITTAIGYCVDYEWPIRTDKPSIDLSKIAMPSIHHWGRAGRQ